MGIQINGQTDRISAVDGTMTFPGTVTYEDVSRVNVTGVSTFAANVHVSDSIAHLGDIDTSIRFPAADTFTVETAGSERLRITSAGLVGIGIDNPNSDLHVQNSSGNCGLRVISSPTGVSYLNLGDTVDNNAGSIEYSNNSNYLLFKTADVERLRITSDGDLGLGVSDGMDQAGTLYIVGGQAVRWTHPTDGTLYGDHYVSAAGAHVLRGGSSLTERLRITSDGEVIKALQPRFHADMLDGGVETNQTAYDGRDVSSHRIEYSNTQYDIGGNFTTSGSNKGLFTVPVEGLYLFHASASIQSGANWAQSWFIVNGSRVRGTDWVLATSSTVAMNSIQLYLSAGATVGFHPYNNASGNTISGTRYHTYFKGCLLG
jgi:hypothetical protein